MKRFLCLGAVLVFLAICAGCGDTFRPIIVPNPGQFPNPQAAHTIVTISDNGPAVSGSAMVIDTAADADVSIKSVGLRPVHAVQQTANTLLVVNRSDPATPQDSVTRLTFAGVFIQSVTTTTLPASRDAQGNLVTAAPNFVATTESMQAYVLMPLYQPPDQNNKGGVIVPSIAVITQGGSPTTIPVGNNPVAMAETPNGAKLYVANQGDGTISAFNTSDRSARPISGALTFPPIWLSARSDSQRVYILEQNGTLAYMDTHLTAGPDTVYESYSPQTVQVPGAADMWYDVILNRLYIPQGQQPQITIVDVSQAAPSVLGGGPIAISTISPSLRSLSDPCAMTTASTGLFVSAVTSLPDGSRAYVGSFYIDSADNVCPQVTVINTSNNTVKTSIPVPGFPDATNPSSVYYVPVCASARFRLNIAAAGDSTRAYLSSCDGGTVNIIDTSVDTYILNVPAPYSARPPLPGATQNPPQNPVFMIAGP